jgi:cytochrome c
MPTHVLALMLFAGALTVLAGAVPLAAAAADAPVAGDPVHGKAVYAMCMYCHGIDVTRVGPMHRGLFGRTAGTLPGYAYSAAMKKAGAKGLVWNAKTLDAYLTNPQKVVPGTKMLFGGIADAKTRADLIAYLAEATAVTPKAEAAPQ